MCFFQQVIDAKSIRVFSRREEARQVSMTCLRMNRK